MPLSVQCSIRDQNLSSQLEAQGRVEIGSLHIHIGLKWLAGRQINDSYRKSMIASHLLRCSATQQDVSKLNPTLPVTQWLKSLVMKYFHREGGPRLLLLITLLV